MRLVLCTFPLCPGAQTPEFGSTKASEGPSIATNHPNRPCGEAASISDTPLMCRVLVSQKQGCVVPLEEMPCAPRSFLRLPHLLALALVLTPDVPEMAGERTGLSTKPLQRGGGGDYFRSIPSLTFLIIPWTKMCRESEVIESNNLGSFWALGKQVRAHACTHTHTARYFSERELLVLLQVPTLAGVLGLPDGVHPTLGAWVAATEADRWAAICVHLPRGTQGPCDLEPGPETCSVPHTLSVPR